MRGNVSQPNGGINNRITAAEEALKRVSVGLITSLNAVFYSRYGRSFLESLVLDPVNTYAEALRAASNGLVESAIKVALRAMGLDPVSVERFVNFVKAGEGDKASALLSSLLRGQPRPNGANRYSL